ncbi:glycoprotein 3-alpha-L-fucosyltransferase A-like [Tachypleus tridentatus]|uniref:glycoprotein 3-alpha-L-fucosyltransferase A-like n=1 Tax=Tachypleus tridentatus TaxID=6853 RepID=UPI003FD5BD7B
MNDSDAVLIPYPELQLPPTTNRRRSEQCLPKMSTDCYNWLEEHYKFYLAFENKICKDYISEKFFAPLSRYVVPVVLGGGDYSSMAPSGSYIDVRDFKSPKDLADFLDVLDRNDSLYSQYFKWKEEYDVIPPTAIEHSYLCELCKRMNNQDIFRKVYPDIRAWWERGGCNAPLVVKLYKK